MTKTHIPETIPQTQAAWRDYASLTKPRVISLLLLTTLAAMLLAAETAPSLLTVVVTLVGGYLAAGGAGALNCYLDCDIDALMSRTRRRPLPAQRLRLGQALLFGIILSVSSFFLLWWGTNLLAATLAFSGILFYVFIYTGWLKRRSAQNIVIGGAAGAIPPLVGWAAITGTLSLTALFLFLIIFIWTPPHFWALALVRRQEYARAGVPMLPVVQGEATTRLHIFRYTLLLVSLTLLPVIFGLMGIVYAGAALLLGGLFLYRAVQLLLAPGAAAAWQLYKYSLLYLALLFVAMVPDRMV